MSVIDDASEAPIPKAFVYAKNKATPKSHTYRKAGFRVLRPNGEKALSARVLLLLNGLVIADGGLSFLTGLPSSSNVDGKWAPTACRRACSRLRQ